MKTYIFILSYCMAGLAASLIPRDLADNGGLFRRAPMRQKGGAKGGGGKDAGASSSLKTPLLSSHSSGSSSSSSSSKPASVKMTFTNPLKKTSNGISVLRKEGSGWKEHKVFKTPPRLTDRHGKPLYVDAKGGYVSKEPKGRPKPPAPGATETLTASHHNRASLSAFSGHAPSSKVDGEATGKRVNVHMNVCEGQVGCIRVKKPDGTWGKDTAYTKEDMRHEYMGSKFSFSNPDGSPVTVQASVAGGGQLKMSGKNYNKPADGRAFHRPVDSYKLENRGLW